jgi:SAM-dependent methyltransferase
MKQEFAEKYGDLQRWHWWFRGRQRIVEAVLHRELNGLSPRTIASLGCGPADGLQWLIPLAGSNGRVLGLDLDPVHARRMVHVDYIVGKLETTPLASGAFDVVLALDVLEHLNDDTGGLREAARLVKSGGLLLLTVPALPSLWGQQDVVSHHYRRYTKPTLRRVFAEVQLPDPSITYFNTLLLPPVAVIRWLRAGQGLTRGSRSDFDWNRPGWINDILAAIFAVERHVIRRMPIPIGVSLLATTRIQ